MKLGEAVSGMFKTYAKKPLLFSGIVLAVNIPLVLLETFLFSSVAAVAVLAIASGSYGALFSVAGIGALVWLVISIVAGVLLLGGTIRAVSYVTQGKSVDILGCLSYAFKRVMDYVVLSLRIFWYSLAWVLILMFVLLPFIAGSMISSTASAQTLDFDPAAFESLMEDGMMDDLAPYMDTDIEGTVRANVQDFTPFLKMSPIFGLVYLVVLIIVIVRLLKTFFAYYILFDNESITTKDALKQSIKLTKGNLWRIIGYSIILGFIFSILSYLYGVIIINTVVGMFSGDAVFIVNAVLLALFAAVTIPMGTIYYYLFYKGVRKENA